MKKPLLLAIAAASATGAAASRDWVAEALATPVFAQSAWMSSYEYAARELAKADRAADAAWTALESKEAFLEHGRILREKMVQAVGGFPERCPLNARVSGKTARDGYTVEKVVFEIRPGMHVTALLYLPDAKKHPPPHPAFVVACGHANEGKAFPGYQRACVLGAKSGFAALIYDPIDQGERRQKRKSREGCTACHNRAGALADLLGYGMAGFRAWDAIRAVDYLQSRPETRPDAIGFMGNSGGGTVTALAMALDPRLKAAAPSCYISSLREVCAAIGPQDAEQNIFGQLAFGLNHAGFVLMNPAPAVRMHFCRGDFFPFKGSCETYRVVRETTARFGIEDRYAMTDVAGPHGWKESARASSLQWMRRWLPAGAPAAPDVDVEACRKLDKTFIPDKEDCGLPAAECLAAPPGGVLAIPGERTIYDILRAELAAAEKARAALPPAEKAKRAAALARIPEQAARPGDFKEISRSETREGRVTRFAAALPGCGLSLPAILFEPAARKHGAPVLVIGDGSRKNRAAAIRRHLAASRAVMTFDTIGTGEIGGRKHRFYTARNSDEELGVSLHLLGRSLVGERAGEIAAACGFLKSRTDTAPLLVAQGRAAIPAAHALAAAPESIAALETESPPPSWSEMVRKAAYCPFADTVHGALREYDWVDLLPSRKTTESAK